MKNQLENLWSKEAEAAVLGSMIVDSSCIDKVVSILNRDSFYRDENGRIFSVLVKLYGDKKPTDCVALRTELKKSDELDKVGGVPYLRQVVESVPSSANSVYYANVVRDRQRYRELLIKVEKIGQVLNEHLTVDEQVQRIRDIALGLQTDITKTEFYEMAEHVRQVIESMQKRKDVLPTGFWNIDRIIQGLYPGEVCVIAGRPSMGKSSLALDIGLNLAKSGKMVLLFSLEMSYQEIIERAISNRSKINLQVLRNRNSTLVSDKVIEVQNELNRHNLIIHEGGTTPEKQAAFIRTLKKSRKLDCVIVDYLQLMNSSKRTENRTQEISTISLKVKRIAMQERVFIIVLSQLNRKSEERANHRPRMSDLRESGTIEQDADVVMLLHREDYYRLHDDPDNKELDGTAELIIAKRRNGPTGIAKLIFSTGCFKFYDLADEDGCASSHKNDTAGTNARHRAVMQAISERTRPAFACRRKRREGGRKIWNLRIKRPRAKPRDFFHGF